MVDESDNGAGAMLMQHDGKEIEYPASYFSQKYNMYQKYSTKALALLLALQHFDVYLNTVLFPITVHTNHGSLVFVHKEH